MNSFTILISLLASSVATSACSGGASGDAATKLQAVTQTDTALAPRSLFVQEGVCTATVSSAIPASFGIDLDESHNVTENEQIWTYETDASIPVRNRAKRANPLRIDATDFSVTFDPPVPGPTVGQLNTPTWTSNATLTDVHGHATTYKCQLLEPFFQGSPPPAAR